MIKLLFTINFLTNGGPTRVLQNILKNLNQNRFQIAILTLINENDSDIVNSLKKNGIEIIELNYNKSLKTVLKNKKLILKNIEDFNPDIIHTHGIVSTFICADKKLKCKKITTIHNNMFEDYKYTYGKIKGIVFSFIHIWKLRYFDLTVCCSKTSYDVLKGMVRNIDYIRNGIDINYSFNQNTRLNIRKELKLDEEDIIYTYGGVINNRKRVVELVELFVKCHKKNEFLLIVGDGPLMSEAKSKADDNVLFTGFKENILDYFISSDIYISNSSSEGFSISVIEALSCGLYCFLSSIPSHKECFLIDDNYYIGENFDNDNFKEKKDLLLKQIDSDRSKLKTFQQKYLSSNVMTEKYVSLYENLIKGDV